jgi:small multidrug resistance pump
MNPYLILGLAIGAEVTATLALKAADGLTRPGPTLIVAVGYGTALWLMSTSMDMLPIGVVYAIWSGVGMIGTALGGAWLYGEAISPTMLAGIAVIAVGVTILAAGQGQH